MGEQLYQELRAANIGALLDDRDERAGVKFKDATQVGVPHRVTVGRGLKGGSVKLSVRATDKTRDVPISRVVNELLGRPAVHEDA